MTLSPCWLLFLTFCNLNIGIELTQNKLYIPVVEVECVYVVEVLAVAEVVVEAAEDDQVPLQQHHPVARPGRGASRGTES